MPETLRPSPQGEPDPDPEALGHPRGTLAIVAVYALLFALGWLALYLFRFLGQGAPHSH
jgi:hypothetical protein